MLRLLIFGSSGRISVKEPGKLSKKQTNKNNDEYYTYFFAFVFVFNSLKSQNNVFIFAYMYYYMNTDQIVVAES